MFGLVVCSLLALGLFVFMAGVLGLVLDFWLFSLIVVWVYLYLLGWILPLGAGFEVACVYVGCGVLVIWVVMIVGCGLIWLFVGLWVIGCLVV